MNRLTLWIWLVVYGALGVLMELLDAQTYVLLVVAVGAALGLHWFSNRIVEEGQQW